MEIKNKVALITGSAAGIGKATALRFLELGAKVCLSDCSTQGPKTLQEFQEKFGNENIIYTHLDVTKMEDYEKAWDYCVKELGPVNILMNNAGIVSNSENWRRCIEINFVGVVNGCKVAEKRMGISSGGTGGVVVNTGSIAGLYKLEAVDVYSATKGAVIQYTRTFGMRHESDGLRVMCICPGIARTRINRLDSEQFVTDPVDTKWFHKEKQRIVPLETSEIADAVVKLIEEGKPNSVMVKANEFSKDTFYVDTPL